MKDLLKKILFFSLMIIFSPLIIVLTIVAVVLALLYLPIDYLRYKKYRELGPYQLLFTIKKRKEIKDLKKKSQI